MIEQGVVFEIVPAPYSGQYLRQCRALSDRPVICAIIVKRRELLGEPEVEHLHQTTFRNENVPGVRSRCMIPWS